MIEKLKNNKFLKKMPFLTVGIIALFICAGVLIICNMINNNQSVSATAAKVRFYGEYRIEDGDWKEIISGEHIPATEGDVTLRGNFHLYSPDGEYIGIFTGSTPIAFYTDHISITIMQSGKPPRMIDHENPDFGISACGVDWTAVYLSAGIAEPLEILVHNPHIFGNEMAIDELLENFAFYGNIEFEKSILDSGSTQRNMGLLFMFISILFFGTALFSTLIHIKKSKVMWLLGFVVLFAGAYLVFSSDGISFWSETVVLNTTANGISMMFYMLFISMTATYFLKRTKIVGIVTVAVIGLYDAILILLPTMSRVFFYDTLPVWTAIQIVANLVLLGAIVWEIKSSESKKSWFHISSILPLVSFIVDAVMTHFGFWQGGFISKYVFFLLLGISTVVMLKIIPHGINATAKARELETEKIALGALLAESRISTMMSQIRPHFIYNTLGSIEQLCEIDPKKAGELVHDFAKYLRGNFGELDNPKPISMTKEMEHVHHYISIENVRFPDMTFSFEMRSGDFNIPALTIQPIVENAIKHGLMKLQKGGTIRVVSYETENEYCVSVTDDGVGFDTSLLLDDRKHVGLRNIRERLRAMVNGEIEIDSTVGVGTNVLIRIPKEEKK